MLYTLKYTTAKNDTVQEVRFPSLAELIMQVVEDFNNKVLVNVDQVVSVTYIEHKQERSAMVSLLNQLKFCTNPADIKLQIKQRLDYLNEGC